MGSINRSRGYAFETYMVERFLKKGYYAYRLGGTTKTMPDIHVINRCNVYGIECKSTQTNIIKVPTEQIKRCFEWVSCHGLYMPFVVIACKFKGNKTKKLKYVYYTVGFKVHYDNHDIIPTYKTISSYIQDKGYITINRNGNIKMSTPMIITIKEKNLFHD